MCGIAGQLLFSRDRRVDPCEVAAMCASLRHRGPDDQGMYVAGNVGLGMRRLAVIDVEDGAQPVTSEDGSVRAVYNGEIYNYRALRRQLEARGHVLRGQGDSEVIVHLYEEHGEDFVTRLRGMFAIALWDARRQRLLLVRDRLGIKPLYFAVEGDRILFGSELKPLLVAGLPREIDPQALHDYLSYSFVPGPRSIFRAARKLGPGEMLVCAGSRVFLRCYWEISRGASERPLSEGEAVEELRALLREAVRDHLQSDVPLGVFLSGGIDSSAVVALVREVSGEELKTFSVGFAERSFNELEKARQVAQRFETAHREIVVTPRAVDWACSLAEFFDEPFADSSALPLYALAQHARKEVTVALCGDGGDELFAGYETYTAARYATAYRRLPAAMTTRLPGLVERLPVSHRRLSFDYRVKRFAAGALLPPEEAHFFWKVIFTEEAKAELYAAGPDGLAPSVRLAAGRFHGSRATDLLGRLLDVDAAIGLPDDMLVKVDRMTMAHSLEARVPLLDDRIVEFATRLPSRLKLRGLTKKYLLKRVMKDRLPWRVLHSGKHGFNVPMPAWLAGELGDFAADVLAEDEVRRIGLFRPRAVSRLIAEHRRRERDWSRNIWTLLVFQLWCERYLRPAAGNAERGAMARASLAAGEGSRR